MTVPRQRATAAMVPPDANSPQPNPPLGSMQDDVHHANVRRLPNCHFARGAGMPDTPARADKGPEYCPLAPFYWGANAPIFRRLFQEVGMFRANSTAIVTALCIAFSAHFNPAAAQDRRVPLSPAELRLSYAPIVQRVQPAVVNVYAAKVVQNHNPLLDDPIFRRFF